MKVEQVGVEVEKFKGGVTAGPMETSVEANQGVKFIRCDVSMLLTCVVVGC